LRIELPVIKNILLVSDGRLHPPLMGRFWLRYALAGMKGYQFSHINSMQDLLKLDPNDFDGMILYFHKKKISDEALSAFDFYIKQGGGVLAIHSVTASFKDSDHFTDILGGKFRGHGRIKPFDVEPIANISDIFASVPSFRVKDELYLHDLQPDIEVQFATTYEGQPVPVVWTRRHGNGRICYACPGHKAASIRVPAYQQVLIRGLAWVCQGSV
jgi:type 1 glutamine amidotransferase